MVHIVAICGSLRKASCNGGLLRAVARNVPAGHSIDIITPGNLPLFNQDVEGPDVVSPAVVEYRKRIKAADAFVFGTSEYNFSISGSLKNAIDWASRGPDGNLFNDKAAGTIGAGGGFGSLRAQNHMRDIALFLNLHMMNSPSYFQIFTNPSPFDLKTGDLVDAEREKEVAKFVQSLIDWNARIAVVKK